MISELQVNKITNTFLTSINNIFSKFCGSRKIPLASKTLEKQEYANTRVS